jgi:hypothetical protein
MGRRDVGLIAALEADLAGEEAIVLKPGPSIATVSSSSSFPFG